MVGETNRLIKLTNLTKKSLSPFWTDFNEPQDEEEEEENEAEAAA